MTDTISTRPSIFNFPVDVVCVGALSIVFLLGLISFGEIIPKTFILGQFATLTVLLNGPHFMASYRLLYSSWEYAKKYPAASIYVPLFLISYTSISILIASLFGIGFLFQVLLYVMGLYLALHYTGQCWGMMASFAFIEGTPFSPYERLVFRTCLRVLTAWQMIWSFTLLDEKPSWLISILHFAIPISNSAAVITLGVGIGVFAAMKKRIGRAPGARVMLPYFALHTWYLFLSIYPQSLFWVQLCHALQYLTFPLRVEVNRGEKQGSSLISSAVRYYGFLVLTSVIIFVGVQKGITIQGQGMGIYWTGLATCINIHHYFIDGCIWKISNPVVKEELFSHLPRPVRA